jgi:uncharacterized YigZ family protein
MKEFYTSILNPAKATLREKGSKFLSFALPAQNETDIRRSLETLRKTYFDATHHCFAWVLDPEGSKFRANDDGEPGHSAGDPILRQIRSRNLTNILVVVVRYYGGTNLGITGLTKAYKTSAALALDQSRFITIEVKQRFKIVFEYENLPVIMKLIKQNAGKIMEQESDHNFKLIVEVPIRAQLKKQLNLLISEGKEIKFQDV